MSASASASLPVVSVEREEVNSLNLILSGRVRTERARFRSCSSLTSTVGAETCAEQAGLKPMKQIKRGRSRRYFSLLLLLLLRESCWNYGAINMFSKPMFVFLVLLIELGQDRMKDEG